MSNLFMIELTFKEQLYYANVAMLQLNATRFHIRFLVSKKGWQIMPDQVVLEEEKDHRLKVIAPEKLPSEISIPLIKAIMAHTRAAS